MKSDIQVSCNDVMGDDLTVVNAARVSFSKHKTEMGLGDKALIAYLAKHKHISPFGHCFASFTVKAPIFVARQLVKHKFLRWNEVSRRYVSSEPEFYEPEWREATTDKKQGSGAAHTDCEGFDKHYGYLMNDCARLYKHLLDHGVCEEQARTVLPLSTMTEWWWSGSLDAFAAMCKLRCAPDAQAETRIVANKISEIMGRNFPVSWKELMNV